MIRPYITKLSFNLDLVTYCFHTGYLLGTIYLESHLLIAHLCRYLWFRAVGIWLVVSFFQL